MDIITRTISNLEEEICQPRAFGNYWIEADLLTKNQSLTLTFKTFAYQTYIENDKTTPF